MPTIQQAQALALKSGAIDAAGQEREGVPNLNTVEAMLGLYAEEFVKAARNNLEQSDSVTTGKLSDSIGINAKIMGRTYTVEFPVLDYYRFVDQGVQGVGPNNQNTTSPFKFKGAWVSKSHRQAIEKWIIQNRLTATARDVSRYGATGRERKSISAEQGRQTLAYIIARSIKRKGLKATNFWSKAFDQTFKDFDTQMSKALGNDIRIELQNMNRDVNNS